MTSVLLYGSYGFVGSLVAREALDRGVDVVLAGRDREALEAHSDDLGCRARGFDLTAPATVAEALADVECVLNCAGPFSNTAEPLVEGCLRSETDYVDITGEIPVIERIESRGETAANAGVTLLPASGFSAVPMDCLAAHLHEHCPDATALSLGLDSFRPPRCRWATSRSPTTRPTFRTWRCTRSFPSPPDWLSNLTGISPRCWRRGRHSGC